MDIIDIGIYAAYILIVLCALSAIIIPLIQSLDDPKSLAKSGMGIAGLIIIFFIGYALADENAVGTTSSTSKYVGAGLITTYVFFFGAIIGIVYTEFSKILK